MKKWFLLLCVWLLGSPAFAQFTNKLEIPSTLSGTEFNLTIKNSTKEFKTGVVTHTYSYNDMQYLGPTLILEKGDLVSFHIQNSSSDTASVHWHGFHVHAQWDGGPMNPILPGAAWSPAFEVKNLASTMWYHSHIHGSTARQVNMGMAGMIIIRDTIEAKLTLPRTYGVDDFPLIIQDKSFNGGGGIENAPLGDVMMVNGTLTPYLECPAQVVRFRLLNASIERVYNIGFSNNRFFSQIGTDGGLLEAPIPLKRLRLAPGERAEILVDFTNETIGSELFLTSYSTELGKGIAGAFKNGPGSGKGLLDSTDFQFLKLKLTAQTGAPVTTLPATLTTIDWINASVIDRVRTKNLLGPVSPGAPFTIDGGHFDMNVINDTVKLGSTEIWKFINRSPLAHPIHIHDVQFNILSRNGVAPAANEHGWKDVVLVLPGDTVQVIARFEDFADSMYTYMMHCHSLVHEDDGMMQQFIVIRPPTSTGVPLSIPVKETVQVYPNPSGSTLHIDLEKVQSGSVRIMSESGQEMLVSSFSHRHDLDIGIENLPRGVYFVQITSNGTAKTVKVVKE